MPKNKLVEAARRKVKAHPKEYKAAYLESAEHPILEHAGLVELMPTVTAANERLKARIKDLESQGWKKVYGGSSKGIINLVAPSGGIDIWLAVDKPRKK